MPRVAYSDTDFESLVRSKGGVVINPRRASLRIPLDAAKNGANASHRLCLLPGKPKPLTKEQRLLKSILDANLPGLWFRELIFSTERNWRVDVASPDLRIAVEIEGGVHRIKKRFEGDMDKYNALSRAGYALLRVRPKEVDSGQALEKIKSLLEVKHLP